MRRSFSWPRATWSRPLLAAIMAALTLLAACSGTKYAYQKEAFDAKGPFDHHFDAPKQAVYQAMKRVALRQGFAIEKDAETSNALVVSKQYQQDNLNTLLTISNQEAAPFLPEVVSGMTTKGITLLLDVPRVADADGALQRMFELGRSLSVTLKGRLVDDNRATLTASSMDKIRQQLRDVHAAMNARGVAPGSPRALRLFS